VAREARRREQVKRGEEPEPSTSTSSGSSDDSLTDQFRRQEEATGKPMSPKTLRALEETALSRSRGVESALRPSAQASDRRGRTSSTQGTDRQEQRAGGRGKTPEVSRVATSGPAPGSRGPSQEPRSGSRGPTTRSSAMPKSAPRAT